MDHSIEELIPHRPPFLLLDRIVSLDKERIRASFTVKEADPLFQQVFTGHYPGNPLTPGVLLCEMVFQAGAALLAAQFPDPGAGVPLLVKVTDARFKQTVRPGDALDITCVFTEQISNAYYLKGSVRKDGKTAVRVSFTCALVPEEEGG